MEHGDELFKYAPQKIMNESVEHINFEFKILLKMVNCSMLKKIKFIMLRYMRILSYNPINKKYLI